MFLYNTELEELWVQKKFIHLELILSEKVTETAATIEKRIISSTQINEEDIDNSRPVDDYEAPSSSKSQSTGTTYCLANSHNSLLVKEHSTLWWPI